jgi:D-glycero-alpha-D-manno-heptose-7-phosphate kinase
MMPGRKQRWHEHAADIAGPAGHQYAHILPDLRNSLPPFGKLVEARQSSNPYFKNFRAFRGKYYCGAVAWVEFSNELWCSHDEAKIVTSEVCEAMILTCRTPLRVSLFGGGTDYPSYFHRHPGAVIGFTIDKYIYTSALSLGAYVDYKFRLSYSRVEMVDEAQNLEHPVVRALLPHYGFERPTDFSIQADLPASAGLGSSSAFTVGFINLVSELQNLPRTKLELAEEAIKIEHEILRENVGIQDQLHAAFGGFNRFNFHGKKISIKPINMTGAALRELTDSMLLIFTGIKRRATDVVAEQVQNTAALKVDSELAAMMELLEEADRILESDKNDRVREIAALLHQSWLLKKQLSAKISSSEIDDLYDFCRRHGALGGKLCGAGGGGFLLMVVPKEIRPTFIEAVGSRRCIAFRVDGQGSQIIGLQPQWRQ